MRILAIESATLTASACILEGDVILGEITTNFKKTHSETLLPMVDSLMKMTGMKVKDMDAFTVSVGPGSFTGLRIGIAGIKGLSFAVNKPCIAVSTIESLAMNGLHTDAIICPMIDARRNQVYTGAFLSEKGMLKRILPDMPLDICEVVEKMEALSKEHGKKILYLGDGATAYKDAILDASKETPVFADFSMNYIRASFTARIAKEKFLRNETVTAEELEAVYLRKSQAEQEREKKGLQTE